MLVSPLQGEDAQRRQPHPLVHGLEALEVSAPRLPVPAARVRRSAIRPAGPVATWTFPPGQVGPRPVESPASVRALLGCSLGWTLRYPADLTGGLARRLPTGPLLYGKLSHRLLELALRTIPEASPEEARAFMAAAFTRQAPRLAAALFLPGADREREDVRTTVLAAAGALFQLLRDAGLSVERVEELIAGPALGTRLEGTPDLVVLDPEGRRAVVDFKWGLGEHSTALERGVALQLAAYAVLLDAPRPATHAYFILRSGRLLTGDAAFFRRASGLNAPPAEQTWQGVTQGHALALARLSRGEALAAGISVTGERQPRGLEGLGPEGVTLNPPCERCAMGALCGRLFVRGAEEDRPWTSS